MKINRISWTNYKGLADDEINARGADVVVSGRNGTGKSSIASVLPFVLFGKMGGTVKQYEGGLTPTDDGKIHAGEVEFTDGLTLRREYMWTERGNQHVLYLNGDKVRQAQFKGLVEKMTGGASEIMVNPLAFCELKAADQREMLVKVFGIVSEETILKQAEFADVAAILEGRTVDKFLSESRYNVKAWTSNLAKIAPAVEELQRQMTDAPSDLNGELEALRRQIAAADVERSKIFDMPASKATQELRAQLSFAERNREKAEADTTLERAKLDTRLDDLERRRGKFTEQISWTSGKVAALRRQYTEVAQSKPGLCPTCGQPLPVEKFKAAQAKQLAEIVEDGKYFAKSLADYERELANIERKITETREARIMLVPTSDADIKIAFLREDLDAAEAQDKSARDELLATANEKITNLIKRRTVLEACAKVTARIAKLQADERELNMRLAKLDEQVKRVEEFRREYIRRAEAGINGQFREVKFKLFDVMITTGEVKPTCEAMLGDVPFAALSTGEKLKAAFDIFNTLQARFKVELPLMIDNAEAYTFNSRVKIPNQKFFFRADESNLTVRVSDGKQIW